MTPKRSETGAALLAVLLLVAVMASLSAVALEKMTLSARIAGNAAALEQARAFAIGAERFAMFRIGDLVRLTGDRTTLAGGWHGVPIQIPLPTGSASATVVDGGNCFNVNSVVQPAPLAQPGAPPVYVDNQGGILQLSALLQVMGTPTEEADRIAFSLADWIDTDGTPGPAGAEDAAYADLPVPYRTPNRLVTDASELLAVAGVTATRYAAIKPWLCALPVAGLSPINVNTLSLEQAPLLAMMVPGQLSLENARNLIARRPANGWADINAFYGEPLLSPLAFGEGVRQQTGLKTSWFRLALDVDLAGAQMSEVALIDARRVPVRLVSRNWGQD